MRARGFTLVEMIVTFAIVAVLAAAALPLAQTTAQRSKELELRRALREIRGALDAYKQAVDEGRIVQRVGESGYPPSLEALVNGVEDAKSPQRLHIRFLRRIPRDPMSPDGATAPAMTWGKRSYASPPDRPREGDDVFDVYSLSDKAGLNGVAYRNW